MNVPRRVRRDETQSRHTRRRERVARLGRILFKATLAAAGAAGAALVVRGIRQDAEINRRIADAFDTGIPSGVRAGEFA